ncbi:helix-turn-helix domain-containing protein [Paenibacillus sp. FSL K6-1230]
MQIPLQNNNFLKKARLEIEEIDQAKGTPDWADGRPLKHHLLLYVRGKAELTVHGMTRSLERESLHLYVPDTGVHLIGSVNAKIEVYWISFDIYRLMESTEKTQHYHRDHSFPVEGQLPMGGSRFRRLLHVLSSAKSGYESLNPYIVPQHLHDLLEELLRAAESREWKDMEQRLRATVDYMHEYYREDVRIEKLAELAQLHPSYYSQVFKRSYGKTPVAYLTQLRMNKAKEMLLQTDHSVQNIAAKVGYRDEFYFSRRFKETSGYSPSIFPQKKHLNLVSLSSAYTDHLFTLGLKPMAAQMHSHMPLVTQSLNLPEHASDPWNISREDFLAMKPDLIVCKDNVLDKAKEHINDIAPIIAIPWTSADVYSHLMSIASLVDREQQAKIWMEHHEARAEQLRKKVRSRAGSGTVAICVCREHELRMYGARNFGHVFYRSLQMQPPVRIQQQLDKHPAGSHFNWIAMTADDIRHYEADYLFVAIETEQDKQRVLEWQHSNPYWRGHPAVRHGRVYFLKWDKWLVYAPFVIKQQLEEASQLLCQSPSSRE